jgi:hypothetical protein
MKKRPNRILISSLFMTILCVAALALVATLDRTIACMAAFTILAIW